MSDDTKDVSQAMRPAVDRLSIEELYARVRSQHRISHGGFRGMVRKHVRAGLIRIETELDGKKFAVLLGRGKDIVIDRTEAGNAPEAGTEAQG